MTPRSDADLSLRVLLCYAAPALVVALPTLPVYLLLPTLYGVEIGLGLTVTGAVLLAARAFDAFSDPVAGMLSDRFSIRGHRRKPWIVLGAVVAGIGLVRLLSPAPDADAAYLLTWSIVLYAGWTLLAVPYAAWGAELSSNYHQRTRITSWREGAALVGILAAGAVNAVLQQSGWSERDAAEALAWVAVGLGAVAFPFLFFGVPEIHPAPASRQQGISWRKSISSVLENQPFLRLVAAWFMNGLANGIPAALFLIYLEHGLGVAAEDRALFILCYFVSAVCAIPLWLALCRRHDKHTVWCWAMASAVAAFALVPFLPSQAAPAFAAICVVTGMALGADLALPPAMQADVVDYGRLKTGRGRTGVMFALWGMSTKLALALAVGTALPLLEWTGFDASRADGGENWALVVIYAGLPVVLKITAIAMIWSFALTSEKHHVIMRRLERTGTPT